MYYYVTDTALNEKLTNKVHLLITWKKKKLNGMIYKVSLRGQGREGGHGNVKTILNNLPEKMSSV